MSTTNLPPTPNQRPLDAFGDASHPLPIPWKEPALRCELCDDASGIIIASDVATLCTDCCDSLAKLPLDQIPATIRVLRHAHRRLGEARSRRDAP